MPKRLFLVVAAILCGVAPAHAQRQHGQLRIAVKDPSGAAVAASGTLENISTGNIQHFETDGEGTFAFNGLTPGRYRLEVTAAGFATRVAGLDIGPSATVTRGIQLSLGAQSSQVDVVATTPLVGSSLSGIETPSPVQGANRGDIENSGAQELSEFLSRRLNGVHLNEIQGNPHQRDLNYRGYTASPLLGTPQGISVYLDGVRLNQPFGDVVSWDLVPTFAISELSLIAGSNPLFGLNTLGGALSVVTRDGRERSHTRMSLSGGSYGRKIGQFEHSGSSRNGLSWYTATNLFFEDGWRAHSPSSVRQFFGRLGWQNAATSLALTAFFANNALIGNGLQEKRLLEADYRSVYTIPDNTANLSPSFNFIARHRIGSVQLSGNVYQRYIRTRTLNGDLNDDSLDQSMYQPNAADRAALTAAGYSGFPSAGENAANTPFPKWRCIAQALQRDEPGEKCNGLINRSHAGQHSAGVSAQGAWFWSGRSWRNQFTAGAAFDHATLDFQQFAELGYLNPDRSITGIHAFADGVTGGTVDGQPLDTRVALDGRVHTASAYFTDTLSFRNWNVTLSGRYNRAAIDNRDRLREGGPDSLTARHTFERFNPAAGVTYSPAGAVNLYFSYSEGSRAPTSVELGCANPDLPCKLPNAMAGDPPLKQVVARTFEGGIRSGAESKAGWSAGWFRAQNSNDILFAASTTTGFGYFKDFGGTLRQGIEMDLHSRAGRLSFGGGYTFLDATYQSPVVVRAAGNSSNDTALAGTPGLDGEIQIKPGNRLALTPRHSLKAYATAAVTARLTVDVSLIAASSSLARGNENNLHQADGSYYIGPGRTGGYGIVNLGARYHATQRMEVFAEVCNLLNHRYATAAQLGATGITPQGTYLARPFGAVGGNYRLVHSTFLAPGAPLGAWGGVRIAF